MEARYGLGFGGHPARGPSIRDPGHDRWPRSHVVWRVGPGVHGPSEVRALVSRSPEFTRDAHRVHSGDVALWLVGEPYVGRGRGPGVRGRAHHLHGGIRGGAEVA